MNLKSFFYVALKQNYLIINFKNNKIVDNTFLLDVQKNLDFSL